MSQFFKFRVQEQIYDSKSMLDENNFYHQRHGSPSELTKKLTYILGRNQNNYPISMMTMGNIASKNAVKALADVQFTYPIMGREDKASVIAKTDYNSDDKIGIGNSIFYLYFQDNWIKRYYIIESAAGIQAYVTDTAEETEDGTYRYACLLHAVDDDASCPYSEVTAGTLWIDLNTQVPESESRGTESKMVAHGRLKNQMGFARADMSWAGNSANKTMNIEIEHPVSKQKTTVWMDYFMWQFENRWLQEKEHMYWYSRYNRKANGQISLKDLITKKVIPTGSGVLEQITNKSTFSHLTYALLEKKIGQALFGLDDAEGTVITLYTGRGGMRDIDRAMKEKGAELLTDFTGIADRFVEGSSKEMMLTGFFVGFYHIDGYVIRVKHNPIFDKGKVAMKSPRHPESGYPLESHRMVFIDDNDYSGMPNLTHVVQEGREFLHGAVPGMAPMPKSLQIMGGVENNGTVSMIAHEVDKSSYHRFMSGGVQLLRGNKCFDLQCIAGLRN